MDELGRGTSTADGFGIAWAVAEHLLCKTRCLTVMATHFHEVTELATAHDGVLNVHMEAVVSGDGITMTHRVVPGACTASFGIHVARLAGMPDAVVACAEVVERELESVRE